jgi:hypothetical protein
MIEIEKKHRELEQKMMEERLEIMREVQMEKYQEDGH